MYQREGKTGWWTSWYDRSSKKKRVRRLAETKELATRVLAKLQHELTTGTFEKKYPRLTLVEYYDRYKADFLPIVTRRSWAWKQRYLIEAYVLPSFGKRMLDSITLYEAAAWYKNLLAQHGRTYCNHIASTFRRMLARAEGMYVDRSPVAGMKLMAKERKLPDTYSPEEVRTLLANSPPRERAMFMLWVHTGLRVAEMQYLQIGDIDLKARKLFVRSKPQHRLKDAEDRWIDLTAACVDEVRPFVDGRDAAEYFYGPAPDRPYLNFTMKACLLCKRYGVPRGNGLLFRHYFASCFISSGGSIMELKRYMGHSSIQTTERAYMAWIPGRRSTVHNVDFGITEPAPRQDRDGYPAGTVVKLAAESPADEETRKPSSAIA